jgi:hypothetical protein
LKLLFQNVFGKQCVNIFLGNNVPTFSWETMDQHFWGGSNSSSFFSGNNGSAFFYPEKTPVGKFRCHSNIIFQPWFTSGVDLNKLFKISRFV